jgi:hypothetical protein
MKPLHRDFELAQMAEHFFGYGRWEAPYWFIGREAAMDNDGKNSLAARYDSWKQLGCFPVVDCAAHHRGFGHRGFGFTKWHQPHPPTRRTWRQFMRAKSNRSDYKRILKVRI